jgi:signal transduction histidine kinase
LPHRGSIADLIRARDWSATPLGPIEAWPAALRTTVGTLLDSSFPHNLMWGPQLVQIYNEAFAATLAERHPDAMGQPASICWPELWHDIGPTIEGVLRTGVPVFVENRAHVIVSAGVSQERWFTYCWSAVRGDDGIASGVLVTVIENTLQVLTQRDNERLVENLRDDDRRKDEFLAILAHELRNPLAPLTFALRLLERNTSLDAAARETLSMAERQRTQLERLVGDLIEAAHITSGNLTLRTESLDLGESVYEAVQSLEPLTGVRRQSVRVELPDRPVHIVADRIRLAQVLGNLLHNASKFTPNDGAIEVRVVELDDGVEVSVTDTGIGIEPAMLGRLFKLFSQIDAPADRSRGGLGIGLALVSRLVALHGWRVSAASDGAGSGTTMKVWLPRDTSGTP